MLNRLFFFHLHTEAERLDPDLVPPTPWGQPASAKHACHLVLEDCVRLMFPGDGEVTGFKLASADGRDGSSAAPRRGRGGRPAAAKRRNRCSKCRKPTHGKTPCADAPGEPTAAAAKHTGRGAAAPKRARAADEPVASDAEDSSEESEVL
jgi:hypothetical protein